MLDRYMSLPYDFRSKIGFNSLLQNVVLKELINIRSLIIIDLDIELKMNYKYFFSMISFEKIAKDKPND